MYFLVSAHEYFGKPINCKIGDKDVQLFAESNCWVNGTFTIKNVPKSESVRPFGLRRQTYFWFFSFLSCWRSPNLGRGCRISKILSMDHSCVIVSSYPVLYTSVPLEKLGTWPNQTIVQCFRFVVQKAMLICLHSAIYRFQVHHSFLQIIKIKGTKSLVICEMTIVEYMQCTFYASSFVKLWIFLLL